MKRHAETLIVPRPTIENLFDMDGALRVVEEAFLEFGLGHARMPSKIYLELPEYKGDFRAMPAYVPKLKAAGVKWVNSHIDNMERGYPTVMGTLILNEPETAWPLAIMDATHITMVRTGAATAVATKYLARKNASILAVVGCGAQAYTQLQALLKIHPFDRIYLFDLNPVLVSSVANSLKDVNCEVFTEKTLESSVRNSDVLVTITPSRKPIIRNEWIKKGTHINAIGADAQGKQELDSELSLFAKIVVDDYDQAMHSGEINIPIHTEMISRKKIYGSLGEIVAGLKKGRENDEEITLFDSTGLAIQDIACARYIYEKCIERGEGTWFKLL